MDLTENKTPLEILRKEYANLLDEFVRVGEALNVKIKQLKAENKELKEELDFYKSKNQQITPDNPRQHVFPFWHDEVGTTSKGMTELEYKTYYQAHREKGGENGY